MGGTKKGRAADPEKSLTNKDVYARVNFLTQASSYLQTQTKLLKETKSKCENQSDEIDKESATKAANFADGCARSSRAVARKGVLKL